MKKLKLFALLFVANIAFAQTFPVNNLQVNGSSTVTGLSTANGIAFLNAGASVSGFFTATGLVTTADLATQAANTILANGTGSTASPTAIAVPSCVTASSALQWTSGTGFSCGTVASAGANSNITSLSGLSTPLSLGQGGTGLTTVPQYSTIVGGPGTLAFVGAGTTGYVWASNGVAAYPSWQGYLSAGTGAVTRTYAAKLSERVSILDFGADPTGVADSTSAIQSAITYVLSLTNGGAVYMPSGTYKVTSQINAPNTAGISLELYGDGAGTRLKYTGAATTNIFFFGSSTPTFGSFYYIHDFGFLGSSGGTITAMYAKNINDALFYNLDVLGNQNALLLEACFNTRVIGVDFNTQAQYGLSTNVTGTNSLLVSNSVISNAGTSAIALGVGGNNIVIRDNDLEANAVTLQLNNYTSVLYEGNYAENNTNSYFSFSGSNAAVDIRQNWLGANTTSTTIANITSGSFVNNTLFNSNFTFSGVLDMDSGGNDITGTSTLGTVPYQTSIALLNTWAAATHTVGYKKSTNGIVEIRGNLTAGASSNGNVAFTLPAAYRPSQQKIFAIYNTSTAAVASCIVDTNGNVVPSGVANGNVVNLDGLMYNAGN